MKKIFVLLLAACLSLAFFGCGEKAIEDTGEIALSLTAGDRALTFTAAQLRNQTITELDAVSINSRGDEKEIHAKGVLLNDLRKLAVVFQERYDSAIANAADGYSIAISSEILRNREILVAFEYNGEPLEKPRLVIPNERAMYWVKNLTSIEFMRSELDKDIAQEYSLEDLVHQLKDDAKEYQYEGTDCKALPIDLILAAIGAEKTEFVEIKAADGLVKTERYSTFAAQMLVFDGTPEVPLFTGPDLPEGMRVKNVTSIQIGDILIKA